jgi:hypothetical protein
MKSTIFWDVTPCSAVQVYHEKSMKQAALLAACVVYPSTLKMEEVISSETSVNFGVKPQKTDTPIRT